MDGGPPPLDVDHDCPECGGEAIERECELLCSSCGLVLEERNAAANPTPSNEGASPKNPSFLTHGLATKIDRRQPSRSGSVSEQEYERVGKQLRKWQYRIRQNNSKERNLDTALNEIHRISSALGVPGVTRQTACVLYRRALDENLIVGYSIETIATASVHIACRREGVPLSLDDFETVSKVPKKKVGRGYRHLQKSLDLEIPPTDPQSYLPRFCSGVDVPSDVEQRAREILDSLRHGPELSGSSPTGLAAAAVYLAAEECSETVSQGEIAEVAGVSVNTVSRQSRKLRQNETVPVS